MCTGKFLLSLSLLLFSDVVVAVILVRLLVAVKLLVKLLVACCCGCLEGFHLTCIRFPS